MAGHSHSHDKSNLHSHSHGSDGNIFALEKGGWSNPSIRVTLIGLIANLAMAVVKGVGGVVFNSKALLADAIHSLSDLIADFLTLGTVTFSGREVNEEFPNGYGKVETLGSLGVSGILLLAGISMGWGSISDISGIDLKFGHSHSHSHSEFGDAENEVDLNAMWLALASIGVKEWLFQSTMRVAQQTGSVVLMANAWHHRLDSLTSIVAVATIGISYLFNAPWLDPVGGLLVSIIIIKAGFEGGIQSVWELVDSSRSVDEETVEKHQEQIKQVLLDNLTTAQYKDKFELYKVILQASGPNLISDVQLLVKDSKVSTSESITVAQILEAELLKSDKKIKRIAVRFIDTDTINRLKKLKKI